MVPINATGRISFMYTTKDFENVTEIFRQTVSGLKMLILFGSYARGDAREDSDIDVAAVVLARPTGETRRRILNALYKKLRENHLSADIVFKPCSEFETDKKIPVTLAHTIISEGKILWQTRD
jgi:predicted nucleotidyltransferase